MSTVAAAENEGGDEKTITELIHNARMLKKSITAFSDVREFGTDEEGTILELPKARRLLEEGRLRYLRDHGFEATLVRYVEAATTPDNLAIVARRVR